MNRSLIRSLAALLVVLCFQSQSTWGQENDVYKVEVGKPHANFALPAINGKEMIQLEDFRGKKLLLFHFASW